MRPHVTNSHPLREDYELELSSLELQKALIEARVFIARRGPQLPTDDDRAEALTRIANVIAEYKSILAGEIPTLK